MSVFAALWLILIESRFFFNADDKCWIFVSFLSTMFLIAKLISDSPLLVTDPFSASELSSGIGKWSRKKVRAMGFIVV